MIEKIEQLLEQLQPQAASMNVPKFNLFTTLLSASDEVYVHSKFLKFLLSPSESHGFQKDFLYAFLKQIEAHNFFDISLLASIRVEAERSFPALKNKGHERDSRIDLLLYSPKSNQALIIENKIWASDQPRQLQRYWDIATDHLYCKKEHIKLFYLSPLGQAPSDSSLGELPKDQVEIISYADDILPWLATCAKIIHQQLPSQHHKALLHAIEQYTHTVQIITGRMSYEQIKPIIDVLTQNDNLTVAAYLNNNWGHVKHHTEHIFWQYLEKKLEPSFGSSVLTQKWSSEKIAKCIYGSGTPWYGLMYELSGTDMALFIERNRGNMTCGITHNKDVNERQKSADNEKKTDWVKKYAAYQSNPYWVIQKPLEPEINFESFAGNYTLQLLNESTRSEIIDEIVKNITQFVIEIKEQFNAVKVV